MRLANTSLFKRILVFWNFSAFIPICSKFALKVTTVRLANASLLKRILVFWNFSAFIPICSKWRISVYFTGVAPLETAPKLERRKKNSPSYSKRRVRKFYVAACRDFTEMYQKACKIYCLTWNLLLFDVFLVAIAPLSLPKPPSFIDVCKLLGVRMWMFLVWTLATWSEYPQCNYPESWFRNISVWIL